MNIKKMASVVIVACAVFAASNVYCAEEGGIQVMLIGRGAERAVNRTYQINVGLDDTVRDMKEKIAMDYAIDPSRQKMMIKGVSLNDDMVVRDLGLGRETIMLLIK